MGNFFIRDAEPSDAGALIGIYGYYVKNTAKTLEYDIPDEEEFRERIINTKKDFPYLVLVEDGEIKGYCYASKFRQRTGYRHSVEVSIYVDVNEKRKGYGRSLYSELEKRLRAIDIKNINVCIVTSENDDDYLDNNSIEFHKKMEYSFVGCFHKVSCKFGHWYDMTWMEKFIGEHC